MDQNDLLMRVRQKIKSAVLGNAGASRGCKVADWTTVFHGMDRDGNGYLTLHEFKTSLRRDLRLPKQTVSDSDAQRVFDYLDMDQSGGISVAEFVSYIRKGDAMAHEMELFKKRKRLERARKQLCAPFQIELDNRDYAGVRRTFQRLDKDGSGELTWSEFHQAMRQELKLAEWDISTRDLEHLFHALDEDNSGAMDAREFAVFLIDGKVPGMPPAPFRRKRNPRPVVPGRIQGYGNKNTAGSRWARWLSKSTPDLSASFANSTRGIAPRGRAAAGAMSPNCSGWITQDIHDWDPDRPR